MAALLLDAGGAVTTTAYPHRTALVVTESMLAVAGVAGAAQLWEGSAAPPVEDIEPLGLHSWRLPAVWLVATVAVPSAVAATLAYRRSPAAPTAAVLASALLAGELLAQIPFVGRSPLQAVLGSVSIGAAGLAVHARRAGWPRR